MLISRSGRLGQLPAGLGLLIVGLLLGCHSRDAEVPGTSLGRLANAHVLTWTVPDPPLLVIGSNDTIRAAAFGRVAGALRLRNGSIVVSDVQPPELKLFDSTGRYLRTVGRTGSGPGEFRWPGPPRRFAGDSFYVVDVELRRVSFFDGQANPVVTRPFPLQVADGVPFPIGIVSSAQFVTTLTFNRYPRRVGERSRSPVEVVTGRFGVPVLDSIAPGRGNETVGGVYNEHGHSIIAGFPVEFGSTTQVAVTSGLVYLGETAKSRIDVFDLRGNPIGHFTWDAPPDPVTEADRRARIAQESTDIAAIPQGPDPAQLWSEVEHLRTVKLPRYAPAFTALLPADDGTLWVEQDPRPWTPTRQYLVFDSTRALVARVTVPRQLEPYQVDGQFVLGRWRNPGEADQVRLYRIIR